jgi:hypothetical protein
MEDGSDYLDLLSQPLGLREKIGENSVAIVGIFFMAFHLVLHTKGSLNLDYAAALRKILLASNEELAPGYLAVSTIMLLMSLRASALNIYRLFCMVSSSQEWHKGARKKVEALELLLGTAILLSGMVCFFLSGSNLLLRGSIFALFAISDLILYVHFVFEDTATILIYLAVLAILMGGAIAFIWGANEKVFCAPAIGAVASTLMFLYLPIKSKILYMVSYYKTAQLFSLLNLCAVLFYMYVVMRAAGAAQLSFLRHRE